MATDRQFQEVVARCVSVMVFYHNDEKTPKARATMVAEVQTVVGFFRELGLGVREVDEHIMTPVEAELVARYGREAGGSLNAEFVRAFETPRIVGHFPTLARGPLTA